MLDVVVALFRGESALDRQIAALKVMNDRELADLGIARDQVEDFARRGLGVQR